MPPRTARERAQRLAQFRAASPNRLPPVEVLPPGAAAPRRSRAAQRAAVRAVLAKHERELERLTVAQARAFLPVLEQAQRELTEQLRRWTYTTPDGELRWTAQNYRTALVQIKALAAQLEQHLGARLTTATGDAQRLALDHLVSEVARFSSVFTGSPRILSLNVARLVEETRSYIIPRIRTSAARYGAQRGPVSVAQDIKRRLAVDILKGAPVYETASRLVEHGGPRGLVALRGVAGEPGAVVENIPEGLFARYRYWATRIVRTETASAYNAQLLDGLHAARAQVPGLVKRWNADASACPAVCAPMDGEIVGLDEPFVLPDGDSVQQAPAHPNCRCRSGAWHRDWPAILNSTD